MGPDISYEFFTITGFWVFHTNSNYLWVIPELVLLIILSFYLLYLFYRNKEKIIISSDFISA